MFPYIGNVIIPTDELIFFRGVGIPPTSHDCLRFLTNYMMLYDVICMYGPCGTFPRTFWSKMVTVGGLYTEMGDHVSIHNIPYEKHITP